MEEPSYRIEVRDLLEDLGATVHIDGSVEIAPITLGEATYPPVGPAHVQATLSNTGAGVVLCGTARVPVTAVCSRCLAEFTLDVAGELEGFYVAHGHEHDLPEEQEYWFIDEGAVDVMPALLASLALAVPFAPVHAEDCPGICPSCGAEAGGDACSCTSEVSASPFAVLKELLPGDGDA